MSKKEQVLVIEPPIGLSSFQRLASMLLFYLWLTRNDLFMFLSELTFTGPFTSAVSSYMKLKNPSDKKVLRILIEEWNFCLTYYTRSASRSRQQLPSDIASNPTLESWIQTMRFRSQSVSSPLSKS